MSQIERKEEEVAENASNKRKWEGNHNRSLRQQNKGHKVPKAHTAWPINKNAYDGSLPLCNQCKSHHSGPCTVKYGNCKKVGHIIQNFETPATAKNRRTITCYECGSLGHYKSECLIVNFHEHVDMIHERIRASKLKTMQDAMEIATKLRNKKISTLVECQTANKKRAYTARHGEKKHYGESKPLCSKCNYHHDGPCAPKCHQCNRFGHLARDCRSSTNANTTNIQKGTGASQKATCYECGNQGHYKRDWFPAQSIGSSSTKALDSPCLLVLNTGTSQSRQHVITSLIHIESCKSPTKSLFDVGSRRISIFIVNTFVSLRCSGKFSRKLRRTLLLHPVN
nr:reverse transcriptase domain-containing protein [Tanacetum cinerariifolium]